MAGTELLGPAEKFAPGRAAGFTSSVGTRTCLYGVFLGLIAATASVHAEQAKLQSTEPIRFEIPAQPLAQALENFGIATGIDVFYNAAIADHRLSNPVMGVFTPSKAMQTMLAGSGFAARVTAPGSVAIGMDHDRNAGQVVPGGDARYEHYFSQVQDKIEQVLCAGPEPSATGGTDLLLRLWLKLSGDVARAEMLVREGETRTANHQSLAAAISRVKFSAPPAEMPQPITLVVLPPSSQSDPACADARGSFDRTVRR